MKKNILLLTAVLITSISFAQEIFLSDSVIYFDKKPVALYAKELSKTPLRYNIEVLNLNYQSLIKAEVMKFDAPVAELKSFFYYELTFPTIKDTLAIYLEDEAFLLVLSKIIRDYKLIKNNTINEFAFRRFKMSYPGGSAFMAQIKSVVDYLDDTRYFRQQTVRDRTKPVSLIHDRVIMQDGKKIGIISFNPPEPNTAGFNSTREVLDGFQVHLVNGRIVDLYKLIGGASYYFFDKESYGSGKNLYNRSFPFNNIYGPNEEHKLRAICYLIENYAL